MGETTDESVIDPRQKHVPFFPTFRNTRRPIKVAINGSLRLIPGGWRGQGVEVTLNYI